MLTQTELKMLLDYNPDTGIFVWKCARGSRAIIGNVAGSKNRHSGYIEIGISGKLYYAHRLVWILFNGDIPYRMQMDHINGVRDDNRIENLRCVTRKINTQNIRHAQKDNKSTGLLGAYKQRHCDKFMAQIKIDGRARFLGYFFTPLEAHQSYLKAKREYHEGCTI